MSTLVSPRVRQLIFALLAVVAAAILIGFASTSANRSHAVRADITWGAVHPADITWGSVHPADITWG